MKAPYKYSILTALLLSASVAYGASIRHEERLIDVVTAINSSDLNSAENLLRGMTSANPDFKLAQMMYADVLKAKTSALYQAGMGLSDQKLRTDLISEINLRYHADQQIKNLRSSLPEALARLDDEYSHVIVVDIEKSRLFLLANDDDHFTRLADFYISIGRGGSGKQKEGDLRTPTGIYFVESYISPAKLTDMYGAKIADEYGAGAFPINYPNELDRQNNLTGSGIWLHGTHSGTYSRPPLASEGCIVLPNDDLIELSSYIRPGTTPVIIGENITWLEDEVWRANKESLNKVFNDWVESWESLNTERYLDHYSRDFSNGRHTYSSWARRKQAIATQKKYIDIEASNVSLLINPDGKTMVATFLQNYKSNNYNGKTWKRLYWKKEVDEKWRIVYEGNVDLPTDIQLAKKD